MSDDHEAGPLRPGVLRRAFWGAAKLVTVGLAAAVAWQVFLDPIFFPIFHDPTNTTAAATISFINSHFSWIPDLVGLTGDSGLLNSEFAQSVLGPHYEQLAMVEDTGTFNRTFGNDLSLDALGG